MRKHGWKILTLSLLSLVLLVVANNASAGWDWEWGCWNCKKSFFSTSPHTTCKLVSDGGSGEGILCRDPVDFCELKGGPCDYIVVTPGGSPGGPGSGGGGTGGGGGGGWGGWGGSGGPGCTLYGLGYCPLNCGTCTVVLF